MLSLACLWAMGRLPGPLPQPGPAAPAWAPPLVRSVACPNGADDADTRPPAPAALAVLALCAVLLCCIAVCAALLAQQRAQARWMAGLLVPAATFNDAHAAAQALQALRQLPQVRQAWLIGSQGRLLAHHVAAAAPLQASTGHPAGKPPLAASSIDGPTCQALAASPGWALHHQRLLLGQTVRFKDVPVGCLCLDIGPVDGVQQAAWVGALALLGFAVWRRRTAQRGSAAA